MVSSTADYALRAVLLLASRDDAQAITSNEIADATGTPRNYMAKVLNAVAKSGLISSTRGPAGGFSLAIRPSEITLGRIFDLFDSPPHHPRCLLGSGPCDLARPCRAHKAWMSVTGAQRAPLLSTTVADLLDGRVAPSPRKSSTESRHVA